MNPDAALETFIVLSAALTGFDRNEIAPPLDPYQIASLYYTKVNAEVPADLDALLAAFAQLQTESAGNLNGHTDLLRTRIWDTAAHGPLARQIVQLWYLGRWNDGPYVSEASYIKALAWRAMETKAIGYSEFTDQYWTRPPSTAKT